MRRIKLYASATGNNKANYTFPSGATIKSVRWSGFFIANANGDDFEAELSKSPVSELGVNTGAATQQISAVNAGADLAAGNEAINSQQLVNEKIGANETIYLNVDFGAGNAEISCLIDLA